MRGHRPVSPLPARDVRRDDRPVPGDRAAHDGAPHRSRESRLPVQRPARLRQDHVGAHPRALPELRRGPDRRPVRRVPELRRALARRQRLARRGRDRRGEPQRRRRRPRPARARGLRAGARPLQDLHPRRGAHGHAAGLQRAAQARRRAARARQVHLRDHRARQGARHHPLAHAPLPVPARAARRRCSSTCSSSAPKRASRSRRACSPLVVRAGGGSPRDTLSLLDQLIAGSEGTTIDYERAVALLGYTHGALLDEVVDAIGARDAAGAFAAADRVVQTGQDPRRFVEDLLERLRDLIVVAASSPEAAAAVLRGVPADELARMAAQAAAFGSAELVARRRPRQPDPHRDDRRHLAAPAPRAHARARARAVEPTTPSAARSPASSGSSAGSASRMPRRMPAGPPPAVAAARRSSRCAGRAVAAAAPAAPARGRAAPAAAAAAPAAHGEPPAGDDSRARGGAHAGSGAVEARGIRSPARGAPPAAPARPPPRRSPSARSRCSRSATPGPRCSPRCSARSAARGWSRSPRRCASSATATCSCWLPERAGRRRASAAVRPAERERAAAQRDRRGARRHA